MNQMNLIFFLLPTDDTNITDFLSLSPDEPDEPDGWRNVLSGSSGLSGDDFYDSNIRVVRIIRWQK